jgi:hypothetical protein
MYRFMPLKDWLVVKINDLSYLIKVDNKLEKMA